MNPLPPELLAKLELLRVATRRVHPGRYSARTRSRRLGAGVDFADHRPYTPGDDLKYVDWALYGRLDQLLIRLSEEETELHVHLLVDVSKSMELDLGGGTDSKAEIAATAACALAYVALTNLDHVRLWPFAAQLGAPIALARRRSEVTRVWDSLASADQGPVTDFEGSVQRFVAARPMRGVVFVISDLLAPNVTNGLDRLLHARHDVAVVQILTPGEVHLPLEGERFDLEDGESGEMLRDIDRAEVERVRERFTAQRQELRDHCRRHGIPLVQTLTGQPTDVESLVMQTFRRGRLVR